MSKPVVLQVGPYPAMDQEPLDDAYDVRRLWEASDSAGFLALNGPEIKAIASRGNMTVDAAMIAACPALEMIAVYGVGYDGVDIETCKARNIRVTNTPDVLTEDVADFGIALLLAHARGVVGGEAWVRSGHWAAQGGFPLGRRVFGQKAGVLGLGRIGYAVARRLAAFDMNIAYTDVSAKDYAPDWTFIPDPVDLARHADILFVTLAASAATRHIVSRAVIDALGPDAMIVNISRASNIDEEALITALQDGRLGSAALDVFDNEPNLDPRFLDLDNVLLTPHHASATVETRRDMGQLVRDNLAAHFKGAPLLTPVL